LGQYSAAGFMRRKMTGRPHGACLAAASLEAPLPCLGFAFMACAAAVHSRGTRGVRAVVVR
jgi:hypothetical protein